MHGLAMSLSLMYNIILAVNLVMTLFQGETGKDIDIFTFMKHSREYFVQRILYLCNIHIIYHNGLPFKTCNARFFHAYTMYIRCLLQMQSQVHLQYAGGFYYEKASA